MTISVETKFIVASAINKKIHSPYCSPLRSSISIKTLDSYAKKIRCGKALMEREGRPGSIDEEGKAALKEFLLQNPNLKVHQIKSFLYPWQLKAYFRRRRLSLEQVSNEIRPKKISSRSVVRYTKKLFPNYFA